MWKMSEEESWCLKDSRCVSKGTRELLIITHFYKRKTAGEVIEKYSMISQSSSTTTESRKTTADTKTTAANNMKDSYKTTERPHQTFTRQNQSQSKKLNAQGTNTDIAVMHKPS